MMETSAAYQKVLKALKRRKTGCTTADVCAATALPLSAVKEFLPKAADEFSGHLRVTQSGEIQYHFPNGFTSRRRGAGVFFKKLFVSAARIISSVLVFLFKAWIVVMLIGYFLLFLALMLASIFISASGKSSNRGRGGYFRFSSFDLLWRFWLYSQLTKPRNSAGRGGKTKEGRPLHKSVFSFVFGEEDPNKDKNEKESRAVIAYLQANRGVISLAEYMAFTGENPQDAEKSILSFCSKYGGSPEATDEGAIVYRFDEILLRSKSQKFAELSPPIENLRKFSANTKGLNTGFILINAVNLFFGSYFLFSSFTPGATSPYLFAFTYTLLEAFTTDTVSIIRTALGLVPFVFSILFWLIPLLRSFFESKENEKIKTGNFKRLGFTKILSSPNKIDTDVFQPFAPECRPKSVSAASERLIKDMGALSVPEIEIDEKGKTIYSFPGLEREKRALQKYREALDPSREKLGDTVFDSAELT